MKMKLLLIAPATRSKGGVYQFSRSCIESIQTSAFNEIVVLSYSNFDLTTHDGIIFRRLNYNIFKSIFLIYSYFLRGYKIFSLSYSIHSLFLINHGTVIHDLQEFYFPQNFSFFQRSYRLLQYIHAKYFSKYILTESESVKEDIVNFLGIRSSKVHVHALAPPAISSNTHKISSNLDSNPLYFSTCRVTDAIHLFYPARPFIHKNHSRLVSSLNYLSESILADYDIKLTLTIPDNTIFSSHLLSLVSHPSITLNLLGYVNDDDLASISNSCSAFIIPSLHESISIPVIEAELYNKPVIVSNIRDFPKQSGPFSYYFNPFSTLSITAAVESFVNDYIERRPSALLFNSGFNTDFQFSSFNKVISEFFHLFNHSFSS